MPSPEWAVNCELIRQTIALYCQLLDDQRYEELSELFTSDADLPWAGRTLHGRAEIVRDLPSTQAERGSTRHLPFAPVIAVERESASAWSDIIVTVQTKSGAAVVGWIGRYHQQFRFEDGRWRIKSHVALTALEPLPAGVIATPGEVPGPLG